MLSVFEGGGAILNGIYFNLPQKNDVYKGTSRVQMAWRFGPEHY
jgi:hypothetical protein